jgi:hypothetical protein
LTIGCSPITAGALSISYAGRTVIGSILGLMDDLPIKLLAYSGLQ